jgi:hypothetical protein
VDPHSDGRKPLSWESRNVRPQRKLEKCKQGLSADRFLGQCPSSSVSGAIDISAKSITAPIPPSSLRTTSGHCDFGFLSF